MFRRSNNVFDQVAITISYEEIINKVKRELCLSERKGGTTKKQGSSSADTERMCLLVLPGTERYVSRMEVT